MEKEKELLTEFRFDCETEESISDSEKAILWPILNSLNIEKKKWEKFRYFPDQLVGLAISCIKERNRVIKNQERVINDLQRKYAEVCQTNMNFRGCPFDPGGKR